MTKKEHQMKPSSCAKASQQNKMKTKRMCVHCKQVVCIKKVWMEEVEDAFASGELYKEISEQPQPLKSHNWRYAAYKVVARKMFKDGKRRKLPWCVELGIKKRFDKEDGTQYTGYVEKDE